MKLKSILKDVSDSVLTINELKTIIGGKTQNCKCRLYGSSNNLIDTFDWKNISNYQCKLDCDNKCNQNFRCKWSVTDHCETLDPVGGSDDGSGS